MTRAGSTMLVATFEDLQGSVEVVVFPRVFEQTAPQWTDDAILLVSGRLDRRDESPQVLCEAVHTWDEATRMGALVFASERDRLLRPRTRGGWGNGNGERVQGVWQRQAIAVAAPAPVAIPIGAADEAPAPADAVPIQAAAASLAATVSVVFPETSGQDTVLGAVEAMTEALKARPGPLAVVLSVPIAGVRRQMRLPLRVAWDEHLADALRRASGVALRVELQPAAAEA